MGARQAEKSVPQKTQQDYLQMLGRMRKEMMSHSQRDQLQPYTLSEIETPSVSINSQEGLDSQLHKELMVKLSINPEWKQHLMQRLTKITRRYKWANKLLFKLEQQGKRPQIRWQSGLFYARLSDKLKTTQSSGFEFRSKHKAWERLLVTYENDLNIPPHLVLQANKCAAVIAKQLQREDNLFNKLIRCFCHWFRIEFGSNPRLSLSASREDSRDWSQNESIPSPVAASINPLDLMKRNIHKFAVIILDTLCLFYKGILPFALCTRVKALLHVCLLDMVVKDQVFAIVFKQLAKACSEQQRQLLYKASELTNAQPSEFGVNSVFALTSWELPSDAEHSYFKPCVSTETRSASSWRGPALPDKGYEQAIQLVSAISQTEGFMGKLVTLKELPNHIVKAIEEYWNRSLVRGKGSVNKDQFIGILCYIIVQANVPQLSAQIGFLSLLCSELDDSVAKWLIHALHIAISYLLKVDIGNVEPKLRDYIPSFAESEDQSVGLVIPVPRPRKNTS